MISKLMAALGLAIAVTACTGPPPPPRVDAFANLYNRAPSTSVPTDAPMTLGQPVAFITSDNVENHIGGIKSAEEYWGKVIPSSLTNTVVMADVDPTYFSAKLIAMLRRHWPDIQPAHDFREAAGSGKKGVILVDMHMKWMEPYGDRTNKIDLDLYFFDGAMNPVSKLSGHAEYKVPFAAMEGHVQIITDEAIGQVDQKISALIH
jgi:hypothetical protein